MDWRHSKVSILGMGKSGLAAAQVLSQRGARVFISDSRESSELEREIEFLRSLGAAYEVGRHSERIYEAQILVVSPGVSVHSPQVVEAFQRGLKVWGEVEVAWLLAQVPFIAVTGTNGKSTTVTLIDRMLGERSILAGNIGTPLVQEVDHAPRGGFITAEISSFQLETVEKFHPQIGILTNITPDHLDRHPNFAEYFAAKARLWAQMGEGDLALFNYDDPQARRMLELLRSGRLPAWLPEYYPPLEREPNPQIMTYSLEGEVPQGAWWEEGWIYYRQGGSRERVVEWTPTLYPGLPGPHNLSNALAAIAVARYLGVEAGAIEAALRAHKPLHYRMEEVAKVQGVSFVDDSKATNVSSVVAALKAYAHGPLILIAGGKDKGFAFEPLAEAIAASCEQVILIGQAAERLEQAIRQVSQLPLYKAATLQEAVEYGWQELRGSGGVLLLSPACSSFDMFKNAEERGRLFAEYAQEIAAR